MRGQQCHNNAVFDVEWTPGHMQLVSASGDYSACLWQVAESRLERVRSFLGHNRSVRTLAYHKTDPSCFASGGRDNAILIWDIRSRNVGNTPKADNCIYSGHTGGPGTPLSHKKNTRQTPKMPANLPNSSITGLVFQDDHTLVSCGAGDGIIKVWDLRRNYSCYKREPLPKHSIPYPGSTSLKGFTNLTLDSTGQRLYVSCMDHNIYCYNLGVYATQPVMAYTGIFNSTFFVKTCISPDDQYLISGSSDHNAYVFNVKRSQPLVKLVGHEKEVTCVAWSRGKETRIVTCCDEARHKVWRINCDNFEVDQSLEYKGQAEPCVEYNNRLPLKVRLKALENTPKTLKRLVERNETTPSSTEKVVTKRTFSQREDDGRAAEATGGDSKRQLIETRARRLFGPSTSTSNGEFGFRRLLPEIAEEAALDSPSPKRLRQESIEPNEKLLSPLNERSNLQNTEARTPSTSYVRSSSVAALFSPTSNLPNYVIDGDAPHLKLQSPKRKLKENVDWLTKIRKQKLLSTINSQLSERLQSPTQNDHNVPGGTSVSSSAVSNELHMAAILSPQMQKLKSSDRPPFNGFCTTPQRRKSTCQHNPAIDELKTTPSRNSGATILRFFSPSTTKVAAAGAAAADGPSTSTQ